MDRWLRGERDLAPHLLLIGRTGSGKTTAARTLLLRAIRQHFCDVIVLDWDAEYLEVPLPVYAPPFQIAAPPLLLADAIAEVEREEYGGHMVAHYLRKVLAATTLEKAAERLRADISLSVTPLRGVLEAAAARLEIVAKHVEFVPFRPDDAELGGLREGVYLLAGITSIWERASVQQFLAMFHTLARRSPVPPALLVVEEGGMGARTTFLRHLLAHARRRGVKLIFISQSMPPAEIRQSFEILLFDTDWEIRRALRAPIPDDSLSPGECWWVRRGGLPKKLRFKLPR